MRWFEGSISDAVASSKARNAVFVVFVEGPDDVSRTVSTAIDASEVSAKLESSDFVAIKLDSGTEPYRQFAQIYQVVPVPSLFFIGRDGRPLEIIAGTSSSSEIVKRIEAILAKARGRPAGSSSSEAERQVAATSTKVSAETARPVTESQQDVADLPSTSAPTSEPRETEAESRKKLEEAKALIERNRVRKLEEEKAKEREREVERRKVGQEVQRLRQWQQDQEYKQLKEDREREKREEAAARERVRNQIAQDKAERAKRNSRAQEEIKEAEKEAQSFPKHVSNSDTARLQLRLPDGSAITHQLASSAPLGELRAFVSDRLGQTASNFSMSTTFPRRLLAPAEDSLTMTQLELVPTAVVLVLPVSAGGIVRAGASASSAITPVTQVFWALLTPFLSIFTYVKNLVFGRGGGNQSGGVSGDASSRRRYSPEPSAQGGPSRRMPATSEVRRQGNSNIHRLAQARDSSDEDNNTWNGNSTQQM